MEIDDEGKPFKSHFTSLESRVPITFPYVPERIYKEKPKEE
jgi:hypothetical protein